MQQTSLPRLRAFTLIEILLVVAILALLAGLVVPSVALAREDAKKVGAEAAAREVQKAILYYRQLTGKLPDLAGSDWSALTKPTLVGEKSVGPFLAIAAINPLASENRSSVLDRDDVGYTDEAAFVYDYHDGNGTGRFLATIPRR